jgi:hypothetical protein
MTGERITYLEWLRQGMPRGQQSMTSDRHNQVAAMNLSGTAVLVGEYECKESASVYFKTEENAEPIYMSVTEADLFIAALQAAKDRAKGN